VLCIKFNMLSLSQEKNRIMAQKKIKIGMKAILIKDTGEVMEIEPENGLNFKLQELYKILNCKLIELVVTKDGKLIEKYGKM